MSPDTPTFRDLSLEQVSVDQIVEVEKEARQRYAKHFAKLPRSYAERLNRQEIQRLLIVMPVTVARIHRKKKEKEEKPQYRVIAGLRSWAVVQLDPGIRKIPCLLLERNSAMLRDEINKTELITSQGLMRSEASDEDWVRAYDAIIDSDRDETATSSPRLNIKTLAGMLGRTEQSIKNWLKKPVAPKGKKGSQ